MMPREFFRHETIKTGEDASPPLSVRECDMAMEMLVEPRPIIAVDYLRQFIARARAQLIEEKPCNFSFPELRQVYRYDCVALALDCILVACGIEEVREEQVMRIARTTPRDGTSSAGVIRVHRRFRLPFRVGQLTPDDLCRNVEHWHATLLFVQAYRDEPEIPWERCWDQGHGVVCTGFDGSGPRRGKPSCRRFRIRRPLLLQPYLPRRARIAAPLARHGSGSRSPDSMGLHHVGAIEVQAGQDCPHGLITRDPRDG